ncbi:MAG TPA: hypothetical protein VFL86_15830 [Burkholderiaceae bacterium]|nr:hypothetical protein [Burkholderiaceae bacterium]
MAKIEDIERRLLNWARWKLGGTSGGLGYAKVRYGDGTTTRGYREAVIPTNDCEAEETDRAVMALPGELRSTVETVYLVNEPLRWKAQHLCCSPSAIKMRTWLAHKKIDQWCAARLERARVERERIEAERSAAGRHHAGGS